MKQDVAIGILREVKDVLDKYNIEFCLDIGTLLGAVRDGKFISWDHDIDLSTWQKNTPQICSACRELRNKGFTLSFSRNGVSIKKENYSLSIILYDLDGSEAILRWGNYTAPRWSWRFLNIFLWISVAPHYGKVSFKASFSIKSFFIITLGKVSRAMPSLFKKWAARIESKWGEKFLWIVPASYFTNLSTIKFYGMEFKVPAKTEEYLKFRYGKDWRIPKKGWITERDDGAVVLAKSCISNV